MSRDNFLAGAGVLIILLFGTAFAFQGELRHWTTGSLLVDFFPYLRRYQPGVAFPLIFTFFMVVWRMLTSEKRRHLIIYAAISGTLLAVLVFSYFYLWTAAIAWFGCIAMLWLIGRWNKRQDVLIGGSIVGMIALGAVIPYFVMLANRTAHTDDAQLLHYTRMPDLLVIPEMIGLATAAVIFFLIFKQRLRMDSPEVLFVLSFALTPVILFNQQIITGRSVQPVHYEIFIANYMVAGAVLLAIWMIAASYGEELVMSKMRRGLIYLSVAATLWGTIESTATAAKYMPFERLREDAMPALNYLNDQYANIDRTLGKDSAILATNLMAADFIPTATPFRPLWNPHTNSAGTVSDSENKDLFYRYLYFSGFTDEDLRKALDEDLFEVKSVLFGGGRALSALNNGADAITRADAREEVDKFKAFIVNVNRIKVADSELAYILVPTEAEPDYRNLDRWYERTDEKVFGKFKIYTLRIKD